jgi:uncharacterized protein YuzE
MKIAYYADTDSLYIDLAAGPSVESREVSAGIVIDFDRDGFITGIDIDHASRLDLGEVALSSLPLVPGSAP